MKFLFFVFVVLAPIFANTQILKNDFFAGGNASFSSTRHTSEDESATTISFAPKGGWFIANKLAAGITGNLSVFSKDGDGFKDFSIGPLARYYLLQPGKHTNIFVETSFLFGAEKYEGFESESKTTWAVTGGPAFFISDNIAFETALYWSSLKRKNDIGRYNSWGITVGLQVHFLNKQH